MRDSHAHPDPSIQLVRMTQLLQRSLGQNILLLFYTFSSWVVYPLTWMSMEEALVQIWQQVLGYEQISVIGNFFDLGGHSLLAAQMVARVRNQLGVDIPLRRVFERPTIADMAQYIMEQEA